MNKVKPLQDIIRVGDLESKERNLFDLIISKESHVFEEINIKTVNVAFHQGLEGKKILICSLLETTDFATKRFYQDHKDNVFHILFKRYNKDESVEYSQEGQYTLRSMEEAFDGSWSVNSLLEYQFVFLEV